MDILQSILNNLPNSTKLSEFESEELILLNPALDRDLRATLTKIANGHRLGSSHVWVTSSGSSASSQREIKLIGLSQKALFASAQAVNEHLDCSKADRWLNVLPLFHVGGLGIIYRAHLSQSDAVNLYDDSFKWNPEAFHQKLKSENITLTSLVPTQIFDLVAKKLRAPHPLRAVVVGGAALGPDLYRQARELGWPLLPSFGMTEVGSQIATAALSSLGCSGSRPKLQILKHMQVRVDENQFLFVKSPSLMSGYFQLLGNSFVENSFVEGTWFKTQDKAVVQNLQLEILGRGDDVIQVLGENVNLAFLREKLATIFSQNHYAGVWALIGSADLRKGSGLVLVLEEKNKSQIQLINQIIAQFNQQVLPFERLTQTSFVDSIPKTPLGKILYGSLLPVTAISKIQKNHST
jgi:O-succinylbenzoic acid--CoA ligase